MHRENFLITLITVVFTNVYFLVTFCICDFTEDQQLGWLVHIELFCLLVVARHFTWMQFSIQVFLFQICLLGWTLFSLISLTFTFIAGAVCYVSVLTVVSFTNLFLVFPGSIP